jgi:DNA-binding GntR family transcriptional regulator
VEEARQIFATRRVLERAAVLELIDKLDAAATAILRQQMGREHEHAEDDRWGTLTITGEFHGLIARLSGNAVMARFIDELVLRTSLIIATFEPRGGEDDCSPDAHPDIASRILARNREGATAAMDAHLRAMEDRLAFDVAPEPVQDLAAIFADLGVGKRSPRRASG